MSILEFKERKHDAKELLVHKNSVMFARQLFHKVSNLAKETKEKMHRSIEGDKNSSKEQSLFDTV
jgi:hypothetical protein